MRIALLIFGQFRSYKKNLKENLKILNSLQKIMKLMFLFYQIKRVIIQKVMKKK